MLNKPVKFLYHHVSFEKPKEVDVYDMRVLDDGDVLVVCFDREENYWLTLPISYLTPIYEDESKKLLG